MTSTAVVLLKRSKTGVSCSAVAAVSVGCYAGTPYLTGLNTTMGYLIGGGR